MWNSCAKFTKSLTPENSKIKVSPRNRIKRKVMRARKKKKSQRTKLLTVPTVIPISTRPEAVELPN